LRLSHKGVVKISYVEGASGRRAHIHVFYSSMNHWTVDGQCSAIHMHGFRV